MEALLDDLRGTVEQLRVLARKSLRDGAIRGSSDLDLRDTIRFAGEAARLVDALLIESTGEVFRRSRTPERDLRLTTRMGSTTSANCCNG